MGWPLTLRRDVADLHPGLIRGHAGFDRGQSDVRLLGFPADGAILMDAHGLGSELLVDDFSTAFDGDTQRLIRAERFLDIDLFPRGVGDAVDADDLIANLDAGFRSRSVGVDPAYEGGAIQSDGIFVVHHVNAGEQGNGEEDVHGGAGESDDEALPARMREKFAGIAGALIHGIFAGHFDVAAERQRY